MVRGRRRLRRPVAALILTTCALSSATIVAPVSTSVISSASASDRDDHRQNEARQREQQERMAEHQRREAERQREQQKKEAERQKQEAEKQRQDAERQREQQKQLAEQQKKEAERQKQETEKQRQDAERQREQQKQLAEQQKKEAEKQKQAAESARKAQEEAQRAQQRQQSQQAQKPAAQQPQPQPQPQNTKPVEAPPSSSTRVEPAANTGPAKTSEPQKTGAQETSGGGAQKDTGPSKTKNVRDEKNQAPETAETKTAEPEDTGPPATMEQWFKRLTQPAPPSTPPPAAAPQPAPVALTPALTPAVAPVSTVPAAPVQTIAAPAAPAIAAPPIAAPAPAAAGPKPAPARPVQLPPIEFPNFATHEVLAVNTSPASVAKLVQLGFTAKGSTAISYLGGAVTRLEAPAGMDAATAEAALKSAAPNAGIAVNHKYRIYKTATGTSVSGASDQLEGEPAGSEQPCSGDHCFAREAIGWKPGLSACTNGLKIGVVDTAIDTTHPAFRHKRIEVSHFFAGGKPGPNWHGTGVLALLAGDQTGGTPGLIPDANFYLADIFHADTDGQPASDTFSMLKAFEWLDSKGVKIINLSLAGPPDSLIQQAIEKLSAKGVLFVAAAGNEGPAAPPSYPAAYDPVIAVTAVNKKMQNYRYANRGSYIDIAAPGVAIWTAMPGAREGYHSGTSFAAPFVTAALAAVYKSLPAQNLADPISYLGAKDLGDNGSDNTYGRGLLVAPPSCSAIEVASSAKPADIVKVAPAGLIKAIAPAAAASIAAEELPWLSLAPRN